MRLYCLWPGCLLLFNITGSSKYQCSKYQSLLYERISCLHLIAFFIYINPIVLHPGLFNSKDQQTQSFAVTSYFFNTEYSIDSLESKKFIDYWKIILFNTVRNIQIKKSM